MKYVFGCRVSFVVFGCKSLPLALLFYLSK